MLVLRDRRKQASKLGLGAGLRYGPAHAMGIGNWDQKIGSGHKIHLKTTLQSVVLPWR